MKRVLVVDDDPATRIGLVELLKQADYECSAVGTFREAMEILRTHSPDLLVTDIRLGDYNGLQLVVERPHPIPAIVITGFADHVLQSEAERAGAAYLLKPVNPRMLLDLAEKLLAQADTAV